MNGKILFSTNIGCKQPDCRSCPICPVGPTKKKDLSKYIRKSCVKLDIHPLFASEDSRWGYGRGASGMPPKP